MDSNVTQTTTSSTPVTNEQEVIIGGAFGGTLPQTKEAIAATMPSFSLEGGEEDSPEDPFSGGFASTQITLDELPVPNHTIEEQKNIIPDESENFQLPIEVPTTDMSDLSTQVPSFEEFHEIRTTTATENTDTNDSFSFDEQDFSVEDFSFDPMTSDSQDTLQNTNTGNNEISITNGAIVEEYMGPLGNENNSISSNEGNISEEKTISPASTTNITNIETNNLPNFDIPIHSETTDTPSIEENSTTIDFELPNTTPSNGEDNSKKGSGASHYQGNSIQDATVEIMPDFDTIDDESTIEGEKNQTSIVEETSQNQKEYAISQEKILSHSTVGQQASPLPEFSFEESKASNTIAQEVDTIHEEVTHHPKPTIENDTENTQAVTQTTTIQEQTTEAIVPGLESFTSLENTNNDSIQFPTTDNNNFNDSIQSGIENEGNTERKHHNENETHTNMGEDITIGGEEQQDEDTQYPNTSTQADDTDAYETDEENKEDTPMDYMNNLEEDFIYEEQHNLNNNNSSIEDEHNDEENIQGVASYEQWQDNKHELSESYQEFTNTLQNYTVLSNSSNLTLLGLRTDEEEVYYTITLTDNNTVSIYKSTNGDTIDFIPTESGLQVLLNDEKIAYFGMEDVDNDITYQLKEKLSKFTMMIQDEYERYQKDYIEAQKKIKNSLRNF